MFEQNTKVPFIDETVSLGPPLSDIFLGSTLHTGEYYYLSRYVLYLLDFFLLLQLYSNQGVSCRNIGQEQLCVKQSGYNRKCDMDPMICTRIVISNVL